MSSGWKVKRYNDMFWSNHHGLVRIGKGFHRQEMGNVMKTVWNQFVGQRISTKRNGFKNREINFNIFSIVPARLFCGDQSENQFELSVS